MTADNTIAAPLAAVVFRGGDAMSFLNGQLSGDARELADGRWQRTAYCSPKGRMIACGLLGKIGDEFYFLLHRDLAAGFAARIAKFVLRAKVSVEHLPNLVTAIKSANADLPKAGIIDDAPVFDDDGWRLKLMSPAATVPAADDEWRRREILRGIPWVSAATAEMFIPQFVNFELLRGVSFKKGCYVGQEVIARLHYLGKVKRRGYILRGRGLPPAAGESLADENGKAAAEVTDAVTDGEGGFVALASVQCKTVESGAAIVHAGEKVTVQKPPVLDGENGV